MESEALILIWRGLTISLAWVMAVLMKLPERIMHSLSEGGERVKPIGAENSDKERMSSINSKYPDYRNTRRGTLTEDAGLGLPDGFCQGFLLLLEELNALLWRWFFSSAACF